MIKLTTGRVCSSRQRRSMSKLLGWTKSLKKSNKLATDAVVLEENNQNAGDSSEFRTQSTDLSIASLSPEMLSPQRYDSLPVVIPTVDLLSEPVSQSTNNTLALNNTQNIVLNFSHMKDFTFGTHIQINNTPDRRSSSGADKGIEMTRSIGCECALFEQCFTLCYVFSLFHYNKMIFDKFSFIFLPSNQ